MKIGVQKRKRKKQYMKAVVIRSYSGVSSIEVRNDLSVPRVLEKNEVLIKVIAASFNDIDLKITRGYGRAIRSHLRKYNRHANDESTIILGRECAGIVLDAGTEVETVCKGDEVWAFSAYCMEGLMAEYVVVTEDRVTIKPKNLTFEEAASLPFTAIQVWNAVSHQAQLSSTSASGKRVLVHAGNSAVGLFAMQLLKSWDADVTTTVPTAGLPMCHELGANDIIVYTVTDFETELRKRQRFELVINTIGSVIHDLCVDICRPGGKIITFVTTPILSDKFGVFTGSLFALSVQAIAWIKKIKHGIFQFRWDNLSYDKEYLLRTVQLAEDRKVLPIIERTYEINDAVSGFHQLAQFENVGKMVLRLSQQENARYIMS
ncbi:reticulon-4-interacting protein 1 homolog, mitochondrial-like isoform X2 [Uloborus diversus]|nr:reticulon-4-interacting protein 1 homolog, mitochondrial-like isoform X2 [Uloborus diversus]